MIRDLYKQREEYILKIDYSHFHIIFPIYFPNYIKKLEIILAK